MSVNQGAEFAFLDRSTVSKTDSLVADYLTNLTLQNSLRRSQFDKPISLETTFTKEDELMTNQAVSTADVERCQKTILDFMPPPVTDKQREALETYRAGNVKDLQATLSLGSDYEVCLCSLLRASQDDSSAIDGINAAAAAALKFAGAADGAELYAKLREILPEQFADR
ncbi:MAG: hypothetical protein ACFB16_11215 [Phormidesmis sp.]